MKIPVPKGVITVFGDQQEARNIEKGHTPGQVNVYQLKTTEERKEPYEEAKRDKEKIEIAADGETKKVYMDICLIGQSQLGLTSIPKKRKSLYNSRTRTKIFSPGQPKICKASTGTSLNTPWKQTKK
jgi:hypothetical protein